MASVQLFVSCTAPFSLSSQIPLPPLKQPVTYEDALSRWNYVAIHNYFIRQHYSSWGPTNNVDTLTIKVLADTIASINYSSGVLLDSNLWKTYKSINGLFERIFSLSTIDTSRFRVTIMYDSIFGYPTYLLFRSLPPAGPTDIVYQYETCDLMTNN